MTSLGGVRLCSFCDLNARDLDIAGIYYWLLSLQWKIPDATTTKRRPEFGVTAGNEPYLLNLYALPPDFAEVAFM
jgi:hypothetical protein